MATNISRKYKTLAILTVIFVYLLIVIGGVVRVSGSGLGCPDWPTCFGSLLPPNGERIEEHPKGGELIRDMGGLDEAVIAAQVEYTHRIIASVGGLFILLTIIGAWLSYRQEKWIFVPANLIIAFMIVQVPLGGIVVLTELEPLAVGIHLGIAFLIFASVITIAMFTMYPQPIITPSEMIQAARKRLLITAAALFVTLMFGAGVVGSNTGLTCPDWPFCNTAANIWLTVPEPYSSRIWFHLLHRYTILAYSILFIWALIRTWHENGQMRLVRQWCIILTVLFVGQISLGAIQVWLDKPPVLRIAHLGLASLVWLALVVFILHFYLEKHKQHPD